MTVQDLLDDVVHRVGKKLIQGNGEPYILRAMNRVYQRINGQFSVLEEELDLAAGTFTSQTYYDMPDRMVSVFRMDPYREFIHPDLFSESNSSHVNGEIFTIYNRRLHFPNADADTAIKMLFYSSGKTLVNDSSASGDNTNAPEWPERYHDILLYGTAIELSHDYPGREEDAGKMQTQLGRFVHEMTFRQDVTPHELVNGRAQNFANKSGGADVDDNGLFDYGNSIW